MDYSWFEQRAVEPSDFSALTFDYFISAYNDSERVQTVFNEVSSPVKIIVLHSEYGVSVPGSLRGKPIIECLVDQDPVESLLVGLRDVGLENADRSSEIGIDITGFMRSHLMVLVYLVKEMGFTSVSYVYSDPRAYAAGSGTTFSKGALLPVQTVPGFEGIHETGLRLPDALVIGAGYDARLLRAIGESKRAAHHQVVFGLPSLQPHMYQESRLRAAEAAEWLNGFGSAALTSFAPADNPFMVAESLQRQIGRLRAVESQRNVYLAALGPKPQVLGFALFYLYECVGTPTSVLAPAITGYSSETSKGVSRLHVYRVNA